MARRKRIWYPGAVHHVMSRGVRKNKIFIDHLDYIHFLKILGDIHEKCPFTIHSLCLMSNHFHMLVGTNEFELSKIMQKILSVYAEHFNHKYDYSGHVFQGRYVASLIEDERHFLEVSRYIHLNPVKACIVKNPERYEYSSYRLFIPGRCIICEGRVMRMMEKLVDPSRVLSYFCTDFAADSKEQYRIFVEGMSSHEEHEILIQKEMREDELWMP